MLPGGPMVGGRKETKIYLERSEDPIQFDMGGSIGWNSSSTYPSGLEQSAG